MAALGDAKVLYELSGNAVEWHGEHTASIPTLPARRQVV